VNIIAMAFISVGYALFYWGSNQIKHWNRSVTDTEAATMKLIFGFPMDTDYQTIHPIPFPFQASTSSRNKGTPADTGSGNGGANLSPTFPGGPNATIPTPKIPGVSNI
jgi:hypothetical protein